MAKGDAETCRFLGYSEYMFVALSARAMWGGELGKCRVAVCVLQIRHLTATGAMKILQSVHEPSWFYSHAAAVDLVASSLCLAPI